MKDIIIGLDAGTSVIKSVAFDMRGRQLASASVPNSYDTLPGGGVEQDMEQTWVKAAATLARLADTLPDLAARTCAVAVTGQGDGTWLIDRDGAPVGKGWLWLDARAAALVEDLRARSQDRDRFAITGTGLAACQQGPQLIWMKRHRPELLAGATTAFHCKDWLYFRLAGERATDPSEGTFTFGDWRRRSYCEKVLAALGLSDLRRLLPETVEGTEHHGRLGADAAAATGLKAGTPVVLGYVDVICTALGAGLYHPRDLPGCTVLGSTGMHMRLVRDGQEMHLNGDATGYTMPMPVPGVVAQVQSNLAATLNIDWVLALASDVLAGEGIARSFTEMVALVEPLMAKAGPASILYQPYVSEAGERGPFVDANARAGFIGISSRHGYGELVRAVFEGLAFAARDCYAAMGPIPNEVRLTGGAAASVTFRGILAGVLGVPVRTSQRLEAGAAGAAMMAAVSVGAYRSMDDCLDDWVTPLLQEAEPPDGALAAIYERAYPAYVEARRALQPVWRSMSLAREQ